MGDYSNICELHGRAKEGKGCTDGSKYPLPLWQCALRNGGACTRVDVDALVFGGALPVIVPPPTPTPTPAPTMFPVYKPAVQASRANTSRTLIAMVGDSTTAGEWCGTPAASGLTNGAHRGAVPFRLAELFIASGLPNVGREAFGYADNVLTAATYKPYNPDAVLAGAWPNQTSASSLGGNLFPATANNDTLGLYDPLGIYDKVEIFYPIIGSGANGTNNFVVAFNDIPVGSFSQRTGTGTVGKSVYTGLAPMQGTQAGITIQKQDANNDGYLIGAIASRTGANGVLPLNFGVSGLTTSGFVNTSQPWNALAALAQIPAKLATFCLGINDWQSGISLDTFAANLGIMIDTAKNAGMDVLLIAPNRTDPTITPQNVQDSYAARMQLVASTRGVAFLDIASLPNMANYAQASGAGLMGDQRHPNTAGARVIAQGIYALIGNPA